MADVNLTITIPDEHVSRVEDAFNGLAGEDITLDSISLNSRKEFNISPKEGGETDKQFAERFIRQSMWRFVKLWEQHEHDDDYEADVSAIIHVQDSVPEGVFT
jgi:hypothetical protein